MSKTYLLSVLYTKEAASRQLGRIGTLEKKAEWLLSSARPPTKRGNICPICG